MAFKIRSLGRRTISKLTSLGVVVMVGLFLLIRLSSAPAFQQPTSQPVVAQAAVQPLFQLPGNASTFAGLTLAPRMDAQGQIATLAFASACNENLYSVAASGNFVDSSNINSASMFRLTFFGAPDTYEDLSLKDEAADLGSLEFYSFATRTLVKSQAIKSVHIKHHGHPGPITITAKATVTLNGVRSEVDLSVQQDVNEILRYEIRQSSTNRLLGKGQGKAGSAALSVGGSPVQKSNFNGLGLLIDPSNGNLVSSMALGGQKGGAVWDGANVWQIEYSNSTLVKVNINAGGGVVGSIPLPAGRWGGIAFDGQNFVLHGQRTGNPNWSLITIQRTDGTVLGEVNPSNPSINGLAYVGNVLYASLSGLDANPQTQLSALATLDPNTGAITSQLNLAPPLFPHAISSDLAGGILILMTTDGNLFGQPCVVYQFKP